MRRREREREAKMMPSSHALTINLLKVFMNYVDYVCWLISSWVESRKHHLHSQPKENYCNLTIAFCELLVFTLLWPYQIYFVLLLLVMGLAWNSQEFFTPRLTQTPSLTETVWADKVKMNLFFGLNRSFEVDNKKGRQKFGTSKAIKVSARCVTMDPAWSMLRILFKQWSKIWINHSDFFLLLDSHSSSFVSDYFIFGHFFCSPGSSETIREGILKSDLKKDVKLNWLITKNFQFWGYFLTIGIFVKFFGDFWGFCDWFRNKILSDHD